MALRELLASRFKSAEGASLTDAVMDARRISEQRAGTGGVEQDLEMLVLVYREWESASTALSRARANQSALLDRWHQQGITRG